MLDATTEKSLRQRMLSVNLFHRTHYHFLYRHVTEVIHLFLVSIVKIVVKLSAFSLKRVETTGCLGLIPLPGFHHL